ncbi:hypothetical protein F5884DRAFT_146485 [Xylogone sp. PMI_703]|nr:hypothetical protein F5884DRAFT_146485 [Xylogone sp. PMI_703]
MELDPLLLAQEELEDQRLLRQSIHIQQEKEKFSCDEDNETTPWLKHTKWPLRFRNRPLDILTAATLQPAIWNHSDYCLGSWLGRPITSPGADERKLRILMHAIDCMFARAEQTLDHTNYRLRCWLQTYHERGFRSVAFNRLRSSSGRKGYIAVWKCFMCLAFRIWARKEALREKIFGVNSRDIEVGQMNYIWNTLLEEDDILSQSEGKVDVEWASDSETDCMRNTWPYQDGGSKMTTMMMMMMMKRMRARRRMRAKMKTNIRMMMMMMKRRRQGGF